MQAPAKTAKTTLVSARPLLRVVWVLIWIDMMLMDMSEASASEELTESWIFVVLQTRAAASSPSLDYNCLNNHLKHQYTAIGDL